MTVNVHFQVEVEPVPKHISNPDRRSEHNRGGYLVQGKAHGLYLQGEDKEERFSLPLHLGQSR